MKSRRSIRKFTTQEIEKEKIEKILEAGRWAPSGQNNQPWKFYIIKERTKRVELAKLTIDERIINDCSLCICVFLDKELMYDRTKDCQAIGACIQNMLLEAYSLGLGSCWLGEILKNKDKVNQLLGLTERYELMAVVALGYPAQAAKSTRRPLKDLTLG
ncbi:MAG TPA: nitroreductase family protein [Elusimicrobia bacterium]|nr:nitroreductase family protein [Elusimicrobiota bacterium]